MKNIHENFTVSVVIPAYNEEGNIDRMASEVMKILENYPNYEIIFVDDGSEDKTLDILKKLGKKNPHITYISLARNFGHQNALKAGLDHANGDCVITMDADLQHPPQLIPPMVERWLEGYEVVYTIRKDDHDLSWIKRRTSGFFYRFLNWVSDIQIPNGAADFRLLDKSVVSVLKGISEYHLFIRGITAWVGFNQFAIEYTPDKRYSGETKYSFRRMVGFALTGITSFSLKPLRFSILLGVILAIFAFIYGIYAICMKFFSQQAIPGWASVLVSVLFIGGAQLIVLGIIGEYIGKAFMESKKRPNYIIREKSK